MALTHPPFRPVLPGGSLGRQAAPARARPSFVASLTDVAILSQFSFSSSTMTRSKHAERISTLPRQKLMMHDLNFLLSELVICHGFCPPTNRRRGGGSFR